jgi:hypothetical protein
LQKDRNARTYRGLARMNADQEENLHHGDTEKSKNKTLKHGGTG